MNPSAIEILASVFFGIAVVHTFCVKRFAHWAHRAPQGSVQSHLLHFLAETEVIFGLWAAALFLGIGALKKSLHDPVAYIDSLNFTESKFVFVVMVVAATRPVVKLAESLITLAARALPLKEGLSFYLAALVLGPLLGSFITEPAAMTLLALVLKRRYFDHGISQRLAYATLGLLFVNVSIGGTLTHFAAPPVLMVAANSIGKRRLCWRRLAGGRRRVASPGWRWPHSFARNFPALCLCEMSASADRNG